MTAEIQLSQTRVGQGTLVEQSRAVAEVRAAIVVAQQCPRDVRSAVQDMKDSCRQMALAERAFFRYGRGGGQVTGPSIHLARELARCWGNMQWGITELRRDDEFGQSEMQAWAWDVQTNARNANTFIVPHRRDTRDGAVQLTDQRDIYENNANNAARRLREAIFSVLPGWFIEDAKALCNETLKKGGGEPLPKRIETAVGRFRELDIAEAQLEEKIGSPVGKWTEQDVATLGVIYKSIRSGEMRKEEEFPAAQAAGRVTVTEITGGAPAQAAAPPAQPEGNAPDEADPEDQWMIRIADISTADEAQMVLSEIDEQVAMDALNDLLAGRYRAAVDARVAQLARKPAGRKGEPR